MAKDGWAALASNPSRMEIWEHRPKKHVRAFWSAKDNSSSSCNIIL